MNLFEYQGKKLFSEFGIPVPAGVLVRKGDDIPTFDSGRVVKAQVLTGGRGKAGAIKKCDDPGEISKVVSEILNMKVKGHVVDSVLVEELCNAEDEYYFSISVNRKQKIFTMMFSDKGGMDIESVAQNEISFVDVNPVIGLRPYMIKKLLLPFGLDANEELTDIIQKAYNLFTSEKLQLIEMNPIARTSGDRVIVLDSKVTLDDNYISDAIGITENESGDLTPTEARIARYGATGVELDGDIAVVCAGAGCSMATADSIVTRGGSVRLIFDIGTLPSDSSDEEDRIWAADAYKAVVELNPKVILFNYFYQAGRLDYEAMTIKYAAEEYAKIAPVILRCKGRMAEEAMEILADTDIYVTNSYSDACDMAVKAAKEGKVWL